MINISKNFLNENLNNSLKIIFLKKIILFKYLFLHKKLKLSQFSKFNKFFLIGFKSCFFFLNSSLNFKIFFRVIELFNFYKKNKLNICFFCFDPKFIKFISKMSKFYKLYCVYGNWFNGFFSKFLYQRALVLKKFSFLKMTKYSMFFPDIAILIGKKNLFALNAISEIRILNIPIITLSDLFFISSKIDYFFLCDLKNTKQIYFYIKFFFYLICLNK